jgi:hypothetical protein
MRRPRPSLATAALAAAIVLMIAACGGGRSAFSGDAAGDAPADAAPDLRVGDVPGDAPPPDLTPRDAAADTPPPDLTPPDAPPDAHPAPRTFVAVSFNTGTSEQLAAADPDDAYTPAHAQASDEWYGDGLAWLPGVAAAQRFLAAVDPDVVVFQEIFWSGECPGIPAEARTDFVCEAWQPGFPTVAQQVVGADYQVACHVGTPDKCAAVHRRFGSFRGCAADVCLEGLAGRRVPGCGSSTRVGRAVIDLVDGGTLTLVSVHATSGLLAADMDCRVRQVEQVFVDLGLGDGPAANGARNLVLGDFNTDPGRWAAADPSAARWNDFVGEGRAFRFLSDVGPAATPTYLVVNIDHAVTDALDGSCWSAGVGGRPEVLPEARYFDHRPLVCTLALP